MTRRRLRVECVALALLAIVVTIPFVDVLVTDARFFVRDLTRYYYPTKKILADIVHGGEFPQWNRFYSAGQPIAANPEYEIFYPPQWLVLIPDFDLGFRLHILVHLYIAAFGMYGLLRSMRLRILPSLSGAVALASGGVLISYINLLPILFAVAWVPWIGWLMLRALARPSAARIAAAGLFVGFQALVGEPTTLVQTWAFALMVAAWIGWGRGRWRGAARCLLITGIILGIGLGVGAVQLRLAADHVGDSARARPFSYGLVTTWSMHPARPLELFVPHVFGHLFGDRTYWGSGMYRNTASPFIYSIYLGLPIAIFAVASFVSRFRGQVFAILILSGTYVVALGEHTPLYKLLYEIGFVRSVRYPEKFFFPALFCIVILGAIGFDRIVRRDTRVKRTSIALLYSIAIVSGILCVVSFSPLGRSLYESVWGIQREAQLTRVLALARQDWVISLLRSAAACGLVYTAVGSMRRWWRPALLVFVLLDLTPVGFGVLPRVDRSFFEAPPVAAELGAEQGEYRLFHEVDWYGRGEEARQYFGSGEDAYWVVRNGMFPMTPAIWGFRTVLERDYDKTALLPTLDFVGAMWQVRDAGQARWREIFGAMSNVRYRAKYRPRDDEATRMKGDARNIRPVEFVEMDLVPRYYFADQVVHLDSPDEFATRLTLETFSPKVAFVEIEAFEPSEGRVISVDESANDARIVADAQGRTLLVASVTRHRYWTVTVDGEPARLLPVNVAYQGVIVGAGHHEIVMRYRNPLLPRFGAISLLTLATCVLLMLLSLPGSRSRTITP